MSTANKLTYLNTTKGKIKDAINLTGANILSEDTFRSYAEKLKLGLVDIINNGTDDLYDSFSKTTQTDTEIALNDTYEAPMKIGLNGNTHQDSYTGKNLLDINSLIPIDNTTQQINGSSLTVTSTRTWARTQKTLTLKANTSYTLMGWVKGTNGYNAGLLVTNSSQSYQQRSFNSVGQRVFLTVKFDTSVSTELSIQLFSNWSGTTANTTAVFEKVMLLEGTYTTEQDYEPYVGSTSDNITPSPNPDYPQQIEVVTGDNTINIHGKNLIYGEDNTSNGVTSTWNNAEVNISGTLTSSWANITQNINKVIPAGTYTFSTNKTTDKYRKLLRVYYADNTYTTITIGKNSTYNTVTLNDEVVKYFIFIDNLTTGDTVNDTFTVQLEPNPTATSYAPYQSKDYEINLGTIELCKIGTYQDYIYKENNKWYKHSEIGKVVLDGSENWNNDGGTQGTDYRHNIYYASRMSIPIAKGTNGTYLSNYFAPRNVSSDVGELGSFYMSNGWLIFVDKNKVYDLAQWKTWLSTHNTIVYYTLATPTNTEITDTDLIEQLEELENAKSVDDKTFISQINEQLPFILDVSALSKN